MVSVSDTSDDDDKEADADASIRDSTSDGDDNNDDDDDGDGDGVDAAVDDVIVSPSCVACLFSSSTASNKRCSGSVSARTYRFVILTKFDDDDDDGERDECGECTYNFGPPVNKEASVVEDKDCRRSKTPTSLYNSMGDGLRGLSLTYPQVTGLLVDNFFIFRSQKKIVEPFFMLQNLRFLHAHLGN